MSGWERTASEVIFTHPRITLVEDEVLLPNGERSHYLRYEGKHYKDFPTVIAVDDEGGILMNEEYAYPSDQLLFQFPEGLTDGDELPMDAAQRELQEEAGIQAKDLKIIGRVLHEHRRSDCYQTIILASGLIKVDRQVGDVEEGEIINHIFTEEEIWARIAEGKIIQKNTLAAWSVYQAYLKTARS